MHQKNASKVVGITNHISCPTAKKTSANVPKSSAMYLLAMLLTLLIVSLVDTSLMKPQFIFMNCENIAYLEG